MSEKIIQDRIKAVLNGRTSPCHVWRNNVGSLPHPENPLIRIKFGLGIGSSDLVGLIKKTGRFLGVEIKTPIGRLSKEQKAWGRVIEEWGGIYIVLRSVEEAESFIQKLRSELEPSHE